ncbi:unnamed protein product [Rotaria magnacalcarata]|uniref:Uncharacterized protein n=2 Tax=Rotaria magnacalcarata TaxID=392030 RepID=A0A817ADL7_9BILA|nr:unnamed protein product [Rotaria magnacalcarata]
MVILIANSVIGQELVPIIHDMTHIDIIHILCRKDVQDNKWVKQWPNTQGIYIKINDICESLYELHRQVAQDAIPISLVPKRVVSEASNQQTVDQLEPSFMYSTLLREILLEINEDDAKSKKRLVAYHHKKRIPESQLEYFQKEYHNKSSIWWYTSECFLYGRTTAQRTIESVYGRIRVVYRGQALSQQDSEHLLDTKGGLVSFNNFLSTSKKSHMVMIFIERTLRKYPGAVSIIFMMTIYPS